MRILVVGAGGIGGYFGGRLQENGHDVTFLVRKKRRAQLEKTGLVIESYHGDAHLIPTLLVSGEEAEPFDIVMLSTKAYHLAQAIEDIKPYISENTYIWPLLNGFQHLDVLKEAFGGEKVLGGLCFIETTLNAEGHIIQTSPSHNALFGALHDDQVHIVREMASAFTSTKASFLYKENILQEIWHKYLFITVLSGVTTLMRAPVGPILEVEGGDTLTRQLFQEVEGVMKAIEAPLAAEIIDTQMKTMKSMTYEMKSSMQRDMEKGYSTEVEHLQGYLLTIAKKKKQHTPLLEAVYHNVKTYELMNRLG
ncbi:ketopantoate reductase family protein [Priestia koreensis]|uniref:ketopantoate reductase family protein n=1 Tax=Priestia koreensis TaxID=284581 RepID=UPI001F55D985|nr:ketopantoate reductase family protein [Priestia koreensis]UNL83653.1 ketopantoate reductase family protein [Priestia koreensis]